MQERKFQSGYIEVMDIAYVFTYDGELFQLVPQQKDTIKPYDFFEK